MTDNKKKNIMLVGVGGQGLVLLARVLTRGLIEAGFDVRSTEQHGMAQRGGSVSTQICYGRKVYSPVFGHGAADILVSLEKLEALRYVHFLKKNGTLLLDEKEIPSLPIITGVLPYPDNISDNLAQQPVYSYVLPASALAAELGDSRAANMVMLGALVKMLNLTGAVNWPEVIAASVKAHTVELNLKAFAAGTGLIQIEEIAVSSCVTN